MKVLVTGATGFVGTYVLRQLLEDDHEVRALVRPDSESKLGDLADRVEVVQGDITQPETLQGQFDGCDAVIHLVGILLNEDARRGITFERIHLDGARNVIDAAKAGGVKRFILMSANGAKPREDAVSAYQWTKFEAEEHLKQSGMAYVIFRPSAIFGQPGPGQPEFMSELGKSLLSIPLVPLPLFREGLPSIAQLVKGLSPFARRWQQQLTRNGTTAEMQPVAVENVAEGMVKALDSKVATGKTYSVAGRDRYRWGEILDLIGAARGRRRPRWKAIVPAFCLRILMTIPGIRALLPITEDALNMLLEGNVCSEVEFVRDFDVKLIPCNVATLAYLRSGAYAPMSASSPTSVTTASPGKFILRHYPVPQPNTGIGLAKFGMWVFLASEVMFFTGLIGAYIILRNAAPTWPLPSERLSLGLTAGMTFLLVVSSMTLVLALSGLQHGKRKKFLLFWGLTTVFGATFVGLQAYEWSHFLAHSGPGTDLFWAVFFTLTGFHGAHVTFGVLALVIVFVKALRGKYTATSHNTVENTGLYWHFVDLVWIILFTIIYLI